MAEDEVNADFSKVLRIAAGTTMQVRENQLRRQQMQQQQQHMTATELNRAQQNAARVVQHDLYHRDFWKHAGTESIADRMTVAASLGENDPTARSAWMHGADVIRSEFGIDLQEINRKHPSSLADRHAALRDALDDHFAQVDQDRMHDAEAWQDRHASPQVAAEEAEAEQAQQHADAERAEAAQADQDQKPAEEAEAAEAQQQADAERADAEQSVNAVDAEQTEATPSRGPAAQPGVGQDDVRADTAGLDARADQRREHAESKADAAAAKAKLDQPVTHADHMGQSSSVLAHQRLSTVRAAQRESFPAEPHVKNPASINKATQKPARGVKQQARDAEVVAAR